MRDNLPDSRLFYCFPFGHTSPDNLINIGSDSHQSNFIYCHDQEPVLPHTHHELFASVHRRNRDLRQGKGPKHAALITSEAASSSVTQVCSKYNWKGYYYFFHGWAALDWYRGYDRSFMIKPLHERAPKRVYFSPNRIIGGERKHRVAMMYQLVKHNCHNGYYSLPSKCPETGMSLGEVASHLFSRYPDITEVLDQISCPANLPGESDHPMHSYCLSQFDSSADSLIYLVTETVASGERLHLTEKIFRPICLQMPFVLLSTRGSLEYLRSYGFQTFGDFIDESYDLEHDDHARMQKIAQTIRDLHDMTLHQRQSLFRAMMPIITHNHQHFYRGGFETRLWHELTTMLQTLVKDFTD